MYTCQQCLKITISLLHSHPQRTFQHLYLQLINQSFTNIQGHHTINPTKKSTFLAPIPHSLTNPRVIRLLIAPRREIHQGPSSPFSLERQLQRKKSSPRTKKKNPSSRSSRIPGNNGGGRGGRPPHAFFRTQRGALSPFLRAQAPPRLFFVARKPRGRRFVLVGSFFARVSLPRIGFAIVSTLLDCQRIIGGMVG